MNHGFSLHRLLSRNVDQRQSAIIYGIVGANLLVFLGWHQSEKSAKAQKFMYQNFTLSNFNIRVNKLYHTMFTSIFSHKDFSHLALNMIGLVTFGFGTIRHIGSKRFVILYLGGGLLSSFCQLVWPYLIPKSWPAYRNYKHGSPSLGASGAINSIVVWNILTFPRNTILIYGILPVRSFVFGAFYIGSDLLSLYDGNSAIGNAAHLGGAAFGALMYSIFRRRF